MRYPQSRCFISDEPTTGLDPNQLIEIRNVIKMVRQNYFSLYIMQEVEAYAIVSSSSITVKSQLIKN
jgi:ABC-type multidrug transport system ATPase subunit